MRLFKSTGAIIVLCIMLALLASVSIPALAQNTMPGSIVNNFGKDPKTERHFTWFTSTSSKTGVIEYCTRDTFHGFDKSNVIRVKARSYETKTDKDTRVIHKAEIKSLKPGTEYVYRVGSSLNGFSSHGIFITATQASDRFTFINITDTQGVTAKEYALWENTLDKALIKFPDARFLLHTGDLVDEGHKISQWDLFADTVKSELMNLPMAPVVGNHDAFNKNNSNPNAKNFTDRYNLPDEQDTGAPSGTVYSFDYGNAHIAVMNTQCGSKNLKKQADWLRSDMLKTRKPWKIVALHRGPYGATYDTTDIRKAWTPVFDELAVDLVFQGHDHNYVRSYPMKNNKRVKAGEGTIYIVSNTGGVKFYPKKSRSWQEVNIQPNLQMYTAVTVEKDKMLIASYDIKGTLRDSFTLKK
jgi:acid phosphatase type 7